LPITEVSIFRGEEPERLGHDLGRVVIVDRELLVARNDKNG
jgi:hypothetical protein